MRRLSSDPKLKSIRQGYILDITPDNRVVVDYNMDNFCKTPRDPIIETYDKIDFDVPPADQFRKLLVVTEKTYIVYWVNQINLGMRMRMILLEAR